MDDIKTILPTVFGGQKKLSLKFYEAILKKKWAEVVGDDIANKSQPIKIDKQKLYISVIDSNWNNHLFMMKNDLLKKIREVLLIKKINDIIFFVGAVKKTLENQNSSEQALQIPVVSLCYDEYKEIDIQLNCIDDDDLRKSARKVLIKDALRKKSILELGHKKCNVCEVVCIPTEGLCSICYIEQLEKINKNIEEILLLMPWLEYDQLKEIFFCDKNIFLKVKSNLENYYVSKLQNDLDNKKILLNYVMLVNCISVEKLSEEIIEKTLMRAKIKLRFSKKEKKNVSTYRQ